MKRLALVTAVVYALLLCVVAGPLVVAAFWPDSAEGLVDLAEAAEGLLSSSRWSWPDESWLTLNLWSAAALTALVGAQFAFLAVPIRIAGQRPVKRRHVFWTYLAAIVMAAVLAVAMVLAVREHLENTSWGDPSTGENGQPVPVPMPAGLSSWAMWGIGALWTAWLVLLAWGSRRREPRALVGRLCRFLLAGSILEFLVAVPAHVIARCRNYCCAGFLTFTGLAAGTAVAVFAFGPAFFFLLVRRVRHKRAAASAVVAKTGSIG